MSGELASTDEAVLQLLRERPLLTVNQMVQRLDVTATAIRQRLSRLLALGLIERCDRKTSRGRPSFQYDLTRKGRRTSGHNSDDLALVLWGEIQHIEDQQIRAAVMTRVVGRLVQMYEDQISGTSLEERLNSIADLFDQRRIPLAVERDDQQLVLKVLGCPYPALADEDGRICEMETELFSRLSGESIKLVRCQRDGASCCTFQPQMTTLVVPPSGQHQVAED